MDKILALPGALLVWFALVVTSTLGLIIGLLSLLAGRTDYASRIFKMHDRTAAVVLGLGDGSKTISYECGTARKDCLFCRLTDPVVSWLLQQKDHYAEEADDKQEGTA